MIWSEITLRVIPGALPKVVVEVSQLKLEDAWIASVTARGDEELMVRIESGSFLTLHAANAEFHRKADRLPGVVQKQDR